MNKRPPLVAPTGDPAERDYRSDKFTLGTLTTITLWHDFLCPWCYVVMFQAEKLRAEFGVSFDWRGAELMPPSLPYTPRPPAPVDPNAPKPPPSRFDLFAEAEGVTMPEVRPTFARTHNALLACEYILQEHGAEVEEAFISAVYRAYWEHREDIADVSVLGRIAEMVGVPAQPLQESVGAGKYNEFILPFDDDAYAAGVRHVPTFVFGGEEVLAEAPYADLARATERFQIRAEKWKNK